MTTPVAPIENTLASGNSSQSAQQTASSSESTAVSRVHLPRITIKFCTQCRWMLRAAYVSLHYHHLHIILHFFSPLVPSKNGFLVGDPKDFRDIFWSYARQYIAPLHANHS